MENQIKTSVFNEEVAQLLSNNKYSDIVKKFTEAKANKEFPNMMWKHIGSKLNNLDTLFGYNEKNGAFFVAVYFEKVKGIRGLLFDGKSKLNFEGKWVCSSWNMFQEKLATFEDDNKCKFKMFFTTTPNRKLRRTLIGGLAEFEQY